MKIYCNKCGTFINEMHFESSKNEIKLRKRYKTVLSKIICRQCYTNGGREMTVWYKLCEKCTKRKDCEVKDKANLIYCKDRETEEVR